MNRKQRLDRLAAFFRDFAALLEEIPADKRDGVKSQFCAAMGDYLKAMEGDAVRRTGYTDAELAKTEYAFSHREIKDIGMLRALRKAGWSMEKLGLEFHCTAERVGEIMRKEGIT